MRVEVLGAERRRRWSFAEKVRIVEETMQSPRQVSEIARRHGLAPSVLFMWRRLAREGRLGGGTPALMPVQIKSAEQDLPPQTASASEPTMPAKLCSNHGLIEIALGDGRVVRVGYDVDADALGRVLQVMERLR